jgi:hypothetical protein
MLILLQMGLVVHHQAMQMNKPRVAPKPTPEWTFHRPKSSEIKGRESDKLKGWRNDHPKGICNLEIRGSPSDDCAPQK